MMDNTGHISINGTQLVVEGEGEGVGVEWHSDAMLRAWKKEPMTMFHAM